MLVREMNLLPLNKQRGMGRGGGGGGGGGVQPTKKKHVTYFMLKSVQFSYFIFI